MRNLFTSCSRAAVVATLGLFLSVSASAQVTLRKALDFDGDSKADLSVFRPEDSNWLIGKTTGGTITQSWGNAIEDFYTPGDYDGDGKSDISVWRDTNGTWFRLNSSDNTVGIVSWGVSGDEAVGRDFDGDGKTDFGIVRRSNGIMTWYIYKSSDNQVIIAQWGATNDYVAPGDYDGDGKFDLAIQRPGATLTSPGTFYIYTMAGNVIVASWGQSNDAIVPGDYDGDNKTDLAVVREGVLPTDPLIWYILKSTDNQAIVRSWGTTATDLTAQGDYDGDGKTDIAVYRDPSATFWIVRSSDGQMQSAPWGQPNDFPIAGYDTH